MLRPAALLSALTLLCLAPACDGGNNDGGDSGNNETGSDRVCGEEWVSTEKDPATPSLMEDFGAACTTDAECAVILGDGGICVKNILGVYDLPGGFCSRPCDLPDTSTSFQHDSEQCSADGGVTCVGAQGLFTACIRECTSHDQCGRVGYGCRNMPTLASEGDPKFCLMSPDDCCTTDSGECGG
jgi:hypothetical protein